MEIGVEVVGVERLGEVRQGPRTDELVMLRRALAVQALAEGYRRGDVAKFLNRTPASITKLLA